MYESEKSCDGSQNNRPSRHEDAQVHRRLRSCEGFIAELEEYADCLSGLEATIARALGALYIRDALRSVHWSVEVAPARCR